MAHTMKAAVMKGIRKIDIDEVAVPIPASEQVLVRIKTVGVCGSDVHYFIEGKIGDYVVKPPFILGHECSGEVVEVGEDVDNLQPGDRVTMEPGVPCGKCPNCFSGRYNLCPDVVFWATPPVNGVFCEYVVHPACFTFPLYEKVGFEEGAMVEPLAVGMYSVIRAGAVPGQSAVILGSGPIGLMTLQALHACGVTRVVAVDLVELRLEKARSLGASLVLNGQKDNVKKMVMDYTGGRGADMVFETAGSVVTTQLTADLSARGGKIVLVGLPSQDCFEYNMNKVIARELDVLGIFRYANVYQGCVDLLNSKAVDLGSLVTQRFPLEKTQEALEYAHEHKAESIKVVVNL